MSSHLYVCIEFIYDAHLPDDGSLSRHLGNPSHSNPINYDPERTLPTLPHSASSNYVPTLPVGVQGMPGPTRWFYNMGTTPAAGISEVSAAQLLLSTSRHESLAQYIQGEFYNVSLVLLQLMTDAAQTSDSGAGQ